MVESTDISAHGLCKLVEKTRQKRFCKSCGSYVLYVLSDKETLYGQQHSTGHGICNKHILRLQRQKQQGFFESHRTFIYIQFLYGFSRIVFVKITNLLQHRVNATYKCVGLSNSWASKIATVSNSSPLVSRVVPKHFPVTLRPMRRIMFLCRFIPSYTEILSEAATSSAFIVP